MSKKVKITVAALLLLASLVLSFGVGYVVGTGAVLEPRSFESVEQAWNIILRDYVANDEIDVDLLAEGAIQGMVEALDDPYTS